MSLRCHLTIEPLGVVLRRPQRRHPPEAAVDDGVSAGEVDDGGGVQLASLRHHRRGVVAGVVRAARHAVDPLQHAAHVAHLGAQVQDGRCRRVSNKLSKRAFLWRPPNCYLSGDTQRLEGIGPAGHDLGLVHQQDSDVVLTFDLRGNEGEEVGGSCSGADGG